MAETIRPQGLKKLKSRSHKHTLDGLSSQSSAKVLHHQTGPSPGKTHPTNKRIQMSRCSRTGCSKMIEKYSFLLYNHNPLSLGLLPAINVILGEGLALTSHQNLSRKVGAQNSHILSYCGRTAAEQGTLLKKHSPMEVKLICFVVKSFSTEFAGKAGGRAT